MKYRRLVPAVVGVSLAFLATVALVGRSLSDTGSVELGEDGEWYYGSFIPQLDYSHTKAALASGTAPAASSPLTATFVASKPPKAKAFEAKQGVTKEGEKHGQHVFAAQTSAAANGLAKKGGESGIRGSTILPAAHLPSAKDIRKQKIDLTLAVLQVIDLLSFSHSFPPFLSVTSAFLHSCFLSPQLLPSLNPPFFWNLSGSSSASSFRRSCLLSCVHFLARKHQQTGRQGD